MTTFVICLAHFCELHGPVPIICTQNVPQEHVQRHLLLPSINMPGCVSCNLILPSTGVNVVTHTDDRVYVSTHYPADEAMYLSVMKLVMKALSVETNPDTLKPMFYGDAVNGYCLNQVFRVTDANARGGERKYALVVVLDLERDLLQNWTVLSQYLAEQIVLWQLRIDTVKRTHSVDNERFLRRSMVKPKLLVELTSDPKVFLKYHLWAMEVLKDLVGET